MLIGLLDDDLAIQEMLRLLLQSEGHQVRVYASASACLADLRIADPLPGPPVPDLLLLDWRLSRTVSGVAIVEQIRANPRLASLPIILMTASMLFDKEELDALQVTLLTKPFDIDVFIHLVNRVTQR